MSFAQQSSGRGGSNGTCVVSRGGGAGTSEDGGVEASGGAGTYDNDDASGSNAVGTSGGGGGNGAGAGGEIQSEPRRRGKEYYILHSSIKYVHIICCCFLKM